MPSKLSPAQLEQIAPKLPPQYPLEHFYEVWDDLYLTLPTQDGHTIVLGSRIAEELKGLQDYLKIERSLLNPKVVRVPLGHKRMAICTDWLATVLNPELVSAESWDSRFRGMNIEEVFEILFVSDQLGIQQLSEFLQNIIKDKAAERKRRLSHQPETGAPPCKREAAGQEKTLLWSQVPDAPHAAKNNVLLMTNDNRSLVVPIAVAERFDGLLNNANFPFNRDGLRVAKVPIDHALASFCINWINDQATGTNKEVLRQRVNAESQDNKLKLLAASDLLGLLPLKNVIQEALMQPLFAGGYEGLCA